MDYIVIDFGKALRRGIWLLVAAALVGAVCGFVYAQFLAAPRYRADVTFYVDNGQSVSASDLTASKDLVKTCREILTTRSVLEAVSSRTTQAYDYETLCDMIDTQTSGDTAIFQVIVTADTPTKCAEIAAVIAQVLPEKVGSIVRGAQMTVIDPPREAGEDAAFPAGYAAVLGLCLGGADGVCAIALRAVYAECRARKKISVNTADQ